MGHEPGRLGQRDRLLLRLVLAFRFRSPRQGERNEPTLRRAEAPTLAPCFARGAHRSALGAKAGQLRAPQPFSLTLRTTWEGGVRPALRVAPPTRASRALRTSRARHCALALCMRPHAYVPCSHALRVRLALRPHPARPLPAPRVPTRARPASRCPGWRSR